MKVTFKTDHEMGSFSFKAGQSAEIITSIAEDLIAEGVCEENKNVTLRDAIVQAVAAEKKDEVTPTEEVKEEHTETTEETTSRRSRRKK